MKSPIALLSLALVAAALAGCGQTGPLYMPKPPVKPAAVTQVPATPAPAPTSTPAQ